MQILIHLSWLCLLPTASAASQSVSLAWNPNSETNLAGYKIYYGTASHQYSISNIVGNATNTTVSGLAEGLTYYFVVTAYDATGLESAPSNEVNYQTPNPGATNQPLSIVGPGNQSTLEDTPKAIPFTIVRGTNTSLAWTALSSDSALVTAANIVITGSGTNYTATITPQPANFGVVTVTLIASNGTQIASTSFSLTVVGVNDVPAIGPIANVSILEDSGPQTVNLSGIGSGAGYEAQTLTVTAVSSNPSLIPNPVVSYVSPAATGSLSFTPRTNANGSAVITVTVNDGGGSNNLATQTFTVSVAAVNDAPTISSIAAQQTPANTATAPIPFIIQDVDSASLTLSASSSNPTLLPTGNVSFSGSGSNRTVQLTPAVGQSGQSTVVIAVSDGQLTATTTFLLTVSPLTNAAPTLNAIGNIAITEDAGLQSVNLSGITSGAPNEPQTLTVTAVSSNPSLIPNPGVNYVSPATTGSLSFTPLANASGSAIITVTVNDGAVTNNLVTQTFTVSVSAVNDAPSITSIPNQQTLANVPTAQIPFIIQDVDSGSLTLSATSSNPTLLPTGNISFSGSGSNRTVQLTPASGQSGQTTIGVTVSDGSSTATSSFLLAVMAVNNPPTLNPIGNLAITEDAGSQNVSLTGITSGATNESQPLILTAASSNPSLIPNPVVTYVSPATTGALSFTPLANASGSATITVTVNDGAGSNNLVTQTFTVSVSAVNDAPTISTIPNQQTLANVPTAQIPFIIQDVDSGSLTLSATSSNPTLLPAGNISFSGSGSNRTVQLTPASGQSGQSTVGITVSDGSLTATATFLFTAMAVNNPPTLNPIGNLALTEDAGAQSVSLSGISSGAINEVQTLTVTAVSSNPSLIPNPVVTYASPATTGSLNFTPAANSSGSATITVAVNDGAGSNNLVTQTFTVSVSAVNDPPIISSIPNQQTLANSPTAQIPFLIQDVDSATLTLSATSSNPTLLPTANISFSGSGSNRMVQLTPAAGHFGQSTVGITVYDGLSTASTTFVLTVTPVNNPPTLSPIGNLAILEDAGSQSVSFSGITSGATNESQILTVTAVSSNPSLIPNPTVNYISPGSTGSLSFTPLANANGAATITVTVNDGAGSNNLVSQTFTVSVSAVNDPPTISSIPNQQIPANTPTAQIPCVIQDIDSASLTLSGNSSNPTLLPTANILFSGSGSNRSVQLIPAAGQFGQSTVTLTVSDGSFTASTTFLLTVTGGNASPTISSIPYQQTSINQSTPQVPFAIEDIDSPSLVLYGTSSNPTLLPTANILLGGSGSNRTLKLTPAADQSGQSTVTIFVSDGLLTASTTFVFTVTRWNQVPAISAIPGQITDFYTPLVSIPVDIGDAETPAENLTLSATSSSSSVLPVSNIAFGGSGSHRTMRITPVAGQCGTSTINVTVNDGNSIATTSFQVKVQAPSAMLTVEKIGTGTVSPDLNGRSLIVGQNYSLKAIPASGQVFAGWSGGVSSSSTSIKFQMATNLVLQARFVTNPYIPLRGTYTALVHESDEVRHERSGLLKLVTTSGGTYSGRLQIGSHSYSLSGQLDLNLHATNSVRRVGTNALNVDLQLVGSLNGEQVSGSVNDGIWWAGVLGDRAVYHAVTNRAPFAGHYTVVLPQDVNASVGPDGDGYGSATVAPGGTVILKGRMADGTPVSQTASLSQRGEWPFYVSLYGGKGSMLGWLTLTNQPDDDITGLLNWIRPGIPASKYYPGGFTNQTQTIGSSYVAPATRTNRVVALTNGVTILAGGPLSQAVINDVYLSNDNHVNNMSSNKLSLTITTTSGMFSGTGIDPATGKPLVFRGALLQKRNAGFGYFLGTNASGRVYVGP